MREILYIQAGPLSSYAGTHFWNTQENYFTYGEDEIPLTDHSISFKEGRDPHNHPTLCPRLLVFDHKSNFGPRVSFQAAEKNSCPSPLWRGPVLRQEQEIIPQSDYHAFLEAESGSNVMNIDAPVDAKIRYWSDYSRVFLDPKSIQAIPDALETAEGNWNANQETFKQYDDDTELMEGSLRLWIEECDNFQGVQMMHNTTTFGGFSHSLLQSFRDEFRKASVLSFAVLSNIMPNDAEIGYAPHTKKIINDGLCLQGLRELCDLTVPILAPPYWKNFTLPSTYAIDPSSLYQSSAVLSAIVESATLPLRLRGGLHDLQTYIAHLNWQRSSPFAQLSGDLLLDTTATKDKISAAIQFSLHSQNNGLPYARRDVTRGFSSEDLIVYKAWSEGFELKHPFLMSHHAPAYPIPTSFPAVFSIPQPKSFQLFSSITTCQSLAGPFSDYATFVQDAHKRRDAGLLAMHLENDDLKELVVNLWETVDGYGDTAKGEGEDGTELGEDEE